MAGFGSAPVSPLPVVGVDVGPAWASALNTAIAELQAIVTPKLGNTQLNVTDADIKHGTRTFQIAAAAGVGVGAAFNAGLLQYWQGAAAGDTVTFSISPIAVNDRVTAVYVYGRANGVTAWSWKLYTLNMTTGVVTQVGATQTSLTPANIQALPITGLTQTLALDTVLIAEWTAGAAGNRCLGGAVQFDKIATP